MNALCCPQLISRKTRSISRLWGKYYNKFNIFQDFFAIYALLLDIMIYRKTIITQILPNNSDLAHVYNYAQTKKMFRFTLERSNILTENITR